MGMAASQVRLLQLTDRKNTIGRELEHLSLQKTSLSRDMQRVTKNYQNALSAKMTDDEKKQENDKQKDAEIKRLQELLKENTLITNKGLVENSTNNIKTLLEIKDDDNDFNTFVSNIVFEDNAKSTSVSKYISDLTTKAYEKGKKDATRDAMGKFGQGQGGNPSNKKEEDSLGKKLAQSSVTAKPTVDYLKRDK